MVNVTRWCHSLKPRLYSNAGPPATRAGQTLHRLNCTRTPRWLTQSTRRCGRIGRSHSARRWHCSTMAKPLFLFAPGAGAPSTSSWMLRFGEGLRALGTVVTFDYPYQTNGRKLPDRLPTLLKAHNEALLAARQEHQGPVVLVGKSMGSRVGCHVSLTHSVDALICFGYPLQSAGKNPKLRDQVLRSLTTPILFVQG